jgi:hypothetical protein
MDGWELFLTSIATGGVFLGPEKPLASVFFLACFHSPAPPSTHLSQEQSDDDSVAIHQSVMDGL